MELRPTDEHNASRASFEQVLPIQRIFRGYSGRKEFKGKDENLVAAILTLAQVINMGNQHDDIKTFAHMFQSEFPQEHQSLMAVMGQLNDVCSQIKDLIDDHRTGRQTSPANQPSDDGAGTAATNGGRVHQINITDDLCSPSSSTIS